MRKGIDKNLKVGLDVDGVLCNFVQGVLDRSEQMGLREHFPATPEDVISWGVSPKFSTVMKDAWTNETFWMNLKPLRDNKLPITPVCYITSRPISARVTERWLKKHKFPYGMVITVNDPREKLEYIKSLQLDCFVDDLIHTVVDLRNEGFNALLYKAPYQVAHKELCLTVPVIETLEEIEDYV